MVGVRSKIGGIGELGHWGIVCWNRFSFSFEENEPLGSFFGIYEVTFMQILVVYLAALVYHKIALS
jgi:hypothetical protein